MLQEVYVKILNETHNDLLTRLASFFTSLTSLYPTKGRKMSRPDVKELSKGKQIKGSK